MNNFTAWKEPTRAGNFVVRYSDGSKLASGRLKKFTKYHIEKTQTMTIDGKLKTGAWLADALVKKTMEDFYKGELQIVDASIPLERLIDEYIEYKETHGAGWRTIQFYEKSFRLLFKNMSNLADLSSHENIIAIKKRMVDEGYANSSIHSYLNSVAIFCNWLVENNRLPKSPFKRGTLPPITPARPRYYTQAEYQALDQALSTINHDAHVGCHLAYHYGLRRIELTGDGHERLEGVLWSDLIERPDNKIDLLIRKEVTKGQKRDRKLRIHPRSLALLGKRKTGPLVPLTYYRFYDHFIAARKRAGINPKLTLHGLRHSFATNFLQRSGSNQPALRDLMGHKDLNTTNIYSHFEQSYLDASMERMNESLAGEKDTII